MARVTSYTYALDRDDCPNFDRLDYPVELQQIRHFENRNPDISVNVYAIDDEDSGDDDERRAVYPLKDEEWTSLETCVAN